MEKKVLDEQKIILVNMCLVEHLHKIVDKLPWYKEVETLLLEINRGKSQRCIRGREVVLQKVEGEQGATPAYTLVDGGDFVTAENMALKARVTQLTKNLEEANQETKRVTNERDALVKERDDAKRHAEKLTQEKMIQEPINKATQAALAELRQTQKQQAAEMAQLRGRSTGNAYVSQPNVTNAPALSYGNSVPHHPSVISVQHAAPNRPPVSSSTIQ